MYNKHIKLLLVFYLANKSSTAVIISLRHCQFTKKHLTSCVL